VRPSEFDIVVEAFEKIESARGRNEKLLYLASLSQSPGTNRMTREVLTYLLHPYWSYGVRVDTRQYAANRKASGFDEYSYKYWPAFKVVLDQLRVRKHLTNKQARESVACVLDSMSHRYAWFLGNVLNRDMHVGVQWTMYDRSFPNLVPGHIIKPEQEAIFKPF
jgi:hypothetical protein